jgi:hypothetical protein
MSFDPTYATQAFLWATVWGGLGVAGRILLARADVRRQRRGAAGRGASNRVR